MLTFNDLQGLIADTFFGGDVGIAGVILFAAALAAVFAIFQNLTTEFALMLPITLVFTSLRILPETMAILMVIVAVVGLATTMRDKVVS